MNNKFWSFLKEEFVASSNVVCHRKFWLDSLIQKRLFAAADDSSAPLYLIACDIIGLGSLGAIPEYVFEEIERIAEIGDMLL